MTGWRIVEQIEHALALLRRREIHVVGSEEEEAWKQFAAILNRGGVLYVHPATRKAIVEHAVRRGIRFDVSRLVERSALPKHVIAVGDQPGSALYNARVLLDEVGSVASRP